MNHEMDLIRLRHFVESAWADSIIERLQAYVRIPNKSPAFDPEWERHGYMDQAIELMKHSAPNYFALDIPDLPRKYW